jgi:HAD superfamily hydrolase (TIGR01509 family)
MMIGPTSINNHQSTILNLMRAVVFDMDGLMFNTEDVYTAVGTELLRRRGRTFTVELKNAMMGLQPQPSFEIMIRRCNLKETWQELVAESNGLFLSLLDDYLAPMPGLRELLDALERAGIPKAIATSSSRELLDACLKPFKMRERFQFILAAEDIAQGKPHPEIYLTAARRFGVAAAEMMVLEDSQNGCRAAAAAGAFAVAIPTEHSREHDFRMASLVVDSLTDPRLYHALGIAARRNEEGGTKKEEN